MEMGDNLDNKQVCRLCLDIVPAADAEAIGEKKKTILEVLLINVDLHVIENAVACSRCMEELQSGFEFKSACLHRDNCISTFVDSDVPVDIKEVFHGEMRDKAIANVNLENRHICRFCLSLIADEAPDYNTDLKDIIANCLPEVDIHIVQEPLVCELCFRRMQKLNEFMKICHEVERRINNHCQAGADHAIRILVSLNDLLKFKDSTSISRLIKEECSNFDNVPMCLKKEDIASIECEEIHIKDELDSGDKMGDSVPSGACYNSGNSKSLKRKRQNRQFTSKGIFKGRKHFSSDGHMARHRGFTKEFTCQECTYKTVRKDILARHIVTHKDTSQVEMHKCENCEFETRRKSSLIRHMLTHHDPKADRKFYCDKCTYETDIKSCLRMHNRIHKDKPEVVVHKCENCEFETRCKSSLIRHMLTHRDPKKFNCDKCPYETYYNFSLRRHCLVHKDKSQVEMHKCKNCRYETRHKSNMIRHMRGHMVKHRDLKVEKKFKCDKCPYQSDRKHYLSQHNLIHKNKSEVEMHKCESCEFETKYKRSMPRHMLNHRDP